MRLIAISCTNRAQYAPPSPPMHALCALLSRYLGSAAIPAKELAMGPFPHDAPPATISAANPAGTDGFEFVEFAHPEPAKLAEMFERMGYVAVARHKTRDITLYRQGDITYVLNADPQSFAGRFVAEHGPC